MVYSILFSCLSSAMRWSLSAVRTQCPTDPKALSEGAKPNAPTADEKLLAALLTHYEKPGVSPPSARMRTVVLHEQHRVQRRQAGNLRRALKLGKMLASKATEITLDVLIHHLLGPRRKSWGLPMTLLSSMMRDVGNHVGLVDIATIRLLISIGEFGPLPGDAVVTPVRFRVRRRHLRGILAPHDAVENGTRELAGEWVTTKESMLRGHESGRIILFLHGGAYYLFSPATHRRITVPLSRATDARVFAVDYRLAPETRFPGPLHDAASAYFRLVDELGVKPDNILIAGDSAGGGLSLALLMYLRDNGYPLPAGAILMSPWVDLTLSCDSWDRNAPYDIIPRPIPGDPLDPVMCYLGAEHVDKLATHPYASPLFGDFKGLPPLLLQTGEVEVLRDEHDLLAAKAKRAGVTIIHEAYEDSIHVFQAFWFLEATERAFQACGSFVHNVLLPASGLNSTTYARLQHDLETNPSLSPARSLRIVRDRAVTDASINSDATLVDDDNEPVSPKSPSKQPCLRSRMSADGLRKVASCTTLLSTVPTRKADRTTSHPDLTSQWSLTIAPVPAATVPKTPNRGRQRAISSPHAYMSPYALLS